MQKYNMKKKKTLTKWKKDCDAIYSRYIRLSKSNKGYCTCVTCGVRKPIKEMQNGHYVPRDCLYLRFVDMNCHPQCISCNIMKDGNKVNYALFMIRTYGQDVLERLDDLKNHNRLFKYTWVDYDEMIIKYKYIIKELCEELKINPWK